MAEPDPAPTPYRDAARVYTRAGWVGVLPVPLGSKKIRGPRATGWTGHTGAWPSGADVQAWMDSDATDEGGGNIALRLPRGVLGLDVDAYDRRPGAATVTTAEQRWGPLPPTWRTTSRDDGTSGIRLYQVPEGLAWPGQLGPGTEIIQYAHRYALVWPSVHPEGRTYRWLTPDGLHATTVPTVDELPALPAAWVTGLTHDRATTSHTKTDLAPTTIQSWVLAAPDGPPCRRMTAALHRALRALSGAGSRHDTTRDSVLRLVRLAQEHHPGLRPALDQLHTAFVTAVTDPARGQHRTTTETAAEWRRILHGAIALVIANPGATGTEGPDPCADPFSDLIASAPITALPPPGPASTVETDDPEAATRIHDHAVAQELHKLRVRDEARRLFAAGQTGHIAPPAPVGLRELLAEPNEDTEYRIEGLWPAGGRVMITAQYKAGKTTMVGNLLRCLADGEQFLGRHSVTRPGGRIVVLDTEMSRGTLRRWLRDQGITDIDRVSVIVLRGRVASFNILDPAVRAQWVDTLRALDAEIIILDCLRPIIDALGLDENHDAGRVLVALDELTEQTGAAELVMVHHMGHTGERSRGDSRLRDWPDAEWRLVRQDDDPRSARFFAAYGRDVEVPETALQFDPDTRHLTIASTGGSRKDVAKAATNASAFSAVLDLLGRSPALSGRAIEAALKPAGYGRDDIRAAVATTIDQNRVFTEPGKQGANLHYLAPSLEDLIAPPTSARPECAERADPPAHSAHSVGSPSARNARALQTARSGVRGGEPPRRGSPAHSTRTDTHPEPPRTLDRALTDRALHCARCQLQAARLVPPDGLCPRCAYPAGGAPEDAEEDTRQGNWP